MKNNNQKQSLVVVDNTLSVSQARKLAKYYGNICQRHNEVETSPEEKQKDWEALSYCRGIILQKSRKNN